MTKIYCDNAATTPIDPVVLRLMDKLSREIYGNPSSLHRIGQSAKAVIERARLQIAAVLKCSPGELIFTGSGSEANNLALIGTLKTGDHLITSSAEHASIYETAKTLSDRGIESTYLTPNQDGSITTEQISQAIRPNTRLISIMTVNNELGTSNPIREMAEFAREKQILFHTDAVQAFGKLPLDMSEDLVTLLSISAHKIYGPKGVGALYVKKGTPLNPLITGGGQEWQLRAGTENVPSIGGFGLAAELMAKHAEKISKRLSEVTQSFIQSMVSHKIKYRINGANQLRGFMSLTLFDIRAEALLINLDLKGICISAGSACSAGSLEPSRVLSAIGMDEIEAANTVRISFGKFNTIEDGEALAEAIADCIPSANQKAGING